MNVCNHTYNVGDKFVYQNYLYIIIDICKDFINAKSRFGIYSFYYDKTSKKIIASI